MPKKDVNKKDEIDEGCGRRRAKTIKRLKSAKEIIKKERVISEDKELRKVVAKEIMSCRQSSCSQTGRASYREVAAKLNQDGVLMKEGNTWTAQAVYGFVNRRWV